jgi:hypothetical protein
MWKYMVMYQGDTPGDIQCEFIECEYITANDRATAAQILCLKLGIDHSLFLGSIEVAPGVDITMSNCGSMIRCRRADVAAATELRKRAA